MKHRTIKAYLSAIQFLQIAKEKGTLSGTLFTNCITSYRESREKRPDWEQGRGKDYR